ncbi:SusC/RagA family TonB-linked outer membrane protein [Spirosoma linguale]|uniref:SusC/RagA family TonB-linked outer membrane protein n=1 Tax=Spirosoma linguale TaxID=108 RepID=UPI0003222E39
MHKLLPLLLIAISINTVLASTTQELLDQRISVQLDNSTIRQALLKLEKTAHVKFVYSRQIIHLDRKVSLVATEEKLAVVLERLLKPLRLQYMVSGSQIAIVPGASAPDSILSESENTGNAGSFKRAGETADRVITGTVQSETGAGLPGVSVVVKNTTRGSTTNAEGNYRLTIPDEATTLVFSFVGYQNQEVAIGNRTTVDVQLVPDNKALDEIVVVGYGTVRKSDLTGSVASVKSEQLTAYPATGAVQALQGRAAGVQIQANNGEPGTSFKVRIRGGNSINASSDPIFVVDGFVGGTLPPPEDIESIEVLKDASATAIYGSRGANGVVMVTTKRGKSGKARIDFNVSHSFQKEIKRLNLLNADQFVSYLKEINPNYVSRGQNTDWQDQILRPGGIQNYQLSLSGGNDNVKYYISGAYFDQKGIVINSDFNRFSITSNIDVKVSDKLRVGLNVFGQRSNKAGVISQELSGGPAGTGVIASAYKFGPDLGIYDANGRFSIAAISDPIDNPYAIATQRQNNTVTDQTQGNLFAEYQLRSDLKFRATLGTTTNTGRTGMYTPTTLNAGASVGGEASMTGFRNTLFQSENYLSYDKSFGEAHRVGVVGGFSYQTSRNESWGGSGQSFISDALSYWNLGSSSVWQAPSSGLTDWKLASWYGRINYALNDRYLVTVNARYDGSSTFSRNHKWAFFPSGAFAWNMGNESFMAGLPWVSQWKWRASYGITGNQAISPYQTLARFSTVYAATNGVGVNAITPSSIANDDLTWETAAQFDLGTDISLFNNRLNLTLDYYRTITSNLLFSVPLPQYSGYTSQLKNIGKLQNQGFEVTLGTRNLTGPLRWDMDVNFSLNRNKVLSLPGGKDIFYSSAPGHLIGLDQTQILREGAPVGSMFGWIYDGVYQTGDAFLTGSGFEQTAGGEKFRDLDGNGAINSNDRTIIGNPNPKFIWGWTNEFKWRNMDLNLFFQGSQGNDMLSYTLMELDLLSGINNATTNALNRWTPQNTNTNVPKASGARTRRVSTRWIYNASYARLKNLAVGYTFPKSFTSRAKISRLRIYASAQNILTITDYPGYDPEVNYNSAGSANGNQNLGLDYGSYPNAKSYTVGLNIGF